MIMPLFFTGLVDMLFFAGSWTTALPEALPEVMLTETLDVAVHPAPLAVKVIVAVPPTSVATFPMALDLGTAVFCFLACNNRD